MCLFIRHVVGVLAVSIAPLALAQVPLTLDEALRLAQARSRQLAAQQATGAAAREMARAASQLPDPALKLGINNLPIDGPDQFSLSRDFMTMRSIGVMQEFTRADKRKARAARYEREAELAQVERVLTVSEVQRDTAIAWLDRHFQERLRALLVQQRDEVRLQVDAAEAAYRGGKGSQADIFAARTAVAQTDDRIALADRDVAMANIQLQRWVGDTQVRPLGAPPTMDSVSLALDQHVIRLTEHPRIATLIKQEEIAQAEMSIAQAERRADWSVELMYNQRGSLYSNMVSINFSIPLQWDRKNRQDREVAAKLALVDKARAQREEAQREHAAEAHAMFEDWRRTRERMVRYDNTLIPLTAERLRATLAAYRGGSANLKSVLDVRRDEVDVRMERLRLEMGAARLWAQLTFLIPTTK